MTKLQLETNISSKEILNLKNGQIASITFPLDNSIKPLSGRVSEVGFVPITMSNSYKMLIDIQESSPNLKLGMIMNFSVEVSEIDSIYLLSNRYILDDKIGNFIWINDNSIAKKIPVNTGDLVGHEIIIEGNLNPGTMVVTDGNRQIKNGSRLKVVK